MEKRKLAIWKFKVKFVQILQKLNLVVMRKLKVLQDNKLEINIV